MATIQELELMKRTAWVNMNRPRRSISDEESQRLVPYVVNAVVYTAVLNGILYDLEDAVKAERKNNDTMRKTLYMLHRTATYAHGEIYRVFNEAIDGFGELYNKRYDVTSRAIEQNVLLEGGLKYYNIALALLRLIRKNNQACGRFRSPALVKLETYIRRLTEKGIPYEDKGRAIEVIIESASNAVIGVEKFKQILL